MLKQITTHILLIITMILIVVMSVVPHHSHKDAVCFVMEYCEADKTFNDEHTSHNAAEHIESDGCTLLSDYLPDTVKVRKDSRCDASCQDDHLNHTFYTILFICADILFRHQKEFQTLRPEYTAYSDFYTSRCVSQLHGLRAPPFV
ncbi:MAG: DUF6769 family protein [Bacteroidales bacterium]